MQAKNETMCDGTPCDGTMAQRKLDSWPGPRAGLVPSSVYNKVKIC